MVAYGHGKRICGFDKALADLPFLPIFIFCIQRQFEIASLEAAKTDLESFVHGRRS